MEPTATAGEHGAQSASGPPATTPLAAEISARIERLPLTRWQVTVRLAIGIVTFFDAFDMLMISYVLPEISRHWQLAPGEATWAIVSGATGMLFGALVSGWLADRFGRVRVICGCLILYSIASLTLAISPTYDFFLFVRFIQGLGLGGEVPIAVTYVNELTRAKGRGRFVLLYEAMFPLGVAVHGLVATLVVPTLGWRWLFAIGALPLPMYFIIKRVAPESPRWLANRGMEREARETMDLIERKVSKYVDGPLPPPKLGPVVPGAARRGKGSMRELFQPPYRRRTLYLWTIWFTMAFVHLGVTNWLPTIYRDHFGLPLQTALGYAAINPWFALAGALFVAGIIDRVGRRWTFGIALSTSGLILITLGALGAEPLALFITFCALLAFVSTIVITGLYLYTPELYPTRSRALGVSMAGMWSRIGAIAGPAAFGFLIHWGGNLPTAFLVLGSVGVLGGIVALIFCEETSGRVLEEVSP